MSTQIERDAVPNSLTSKMRPDHNGRLEVAWRVYHALCQIGTGDLTIQQRNLLGLEKKAAYERWVSEGELMDEDGLQGKRGFAAARKKHLKWLDERDAKIEAAKGKKA